MKLPLSVSVKSTGRYPEAYQVLIYCQSQKDAERVAKPAFDEIKASMLPCGCAADLDDPKGPVYWNPFNFVVRCHKCGGIYEPKKRN